MTGRNSARGIRPNGLKIRKLRKRLGMSQRDFAARYAVTARTLQRAESGERILPELLSSIAAGLRVTAADLTLLPAGASENPLYPPQSKEQIRLQRTSSAREIVTALEDAQGFEFLYDIDPDEQTADELAAAIETLELLAGTTGGGGTEAAAYIRQLGRLNSTLNLLEKNNIRFYIGSYWEPDVVIEEVEPDSDNSSHYCRVELVCNALIFIAETDLRYITRPITRKYTDEQIDTSIQELRGFGWHVEDKRPFSRSSNLNNSAGSVA